jgi:hypothetical protein
MPLPRPPLIFVLGGRPLRPRPLPEPEAKLEFEPVPLLSGDRGSRKSKSSGYTTLQVYKVTIKI